MKFDFGMNDTAPLEETAETEITPEDEMLLPIDVRFTENGYWFSVHVDRKVLKDIMNETAIPSLDKELWEICLVTMEGEECNMRYIYSFQTNKWRFE